MDGLRQNIQSSLKLLFVQKVNAQLTQEEGFMFGMARRRANETLDHCGLPRDPARHWP